ncbi:MAG: PEGA domain-containing protein [Proteobacteria bacterium]|nr:PEGA domain-containing protein [Pseudomonadota bacterium]
MPAAVAPARARAEAPSATVSMAMRGSSMIMPRPRRRWPILAIVGGAVVVTVGVVAIARRGPAAPALIVDPETSVVVPVDHASTILQPDSVAVELGSGGRPKVKPSTRIEPRAKPEPRVEPKVEPKIEAKVEPKVQPKVEPPKITPPIVKPDVVTAPPDAAPPVVAEPGRFAVDSVPYAKIFVDGRAVGETPLVIDLVAGHHTIRAVLQDGREQTRDVLVAAGGRVNLGRLTWPAQ